jgi:hypothetical protein
LKKPWTNYGGYSEGKSGSYQGIADLASPYRLRRSNAVWSLMDLGEAARLRSNIDIVKRLSISALATVSVFEKGQEVARLVGLQNKERLKRSKLLSR